MRPAPASGDASHAPSTTAATHGAHGHGYTSPGSGQPALPPRPPSPMREALSPQVHTSDSLARRMAEVEDEDERRLAENMFM